MRPNKGLKQSFSISLPPIILLGTAMAGCFLGLILAGPLDNELLRRYCLSHPIAVTCVCLFFVGLFTLATKWTQALVQQQAGRKAADQLRRFTDEGSEIRSSQRAEWLQANWEGTSSAIQGSWLGLRLRQIVELQISRGRQHQLESDLQMTAEGDADRQHESYSLVRIINWAMPMLGFLGTVLGISQTLGQLDTQKLATQQQEAMNELTAGLYVAFDTTAIALILTVTLMFIQFAVSRLEVRLLAAIDVACQRNLIEFLGSDPFGAQDTLLAPVREMADRLANSIEDLIENQTQVWSRTLSDTQRHWQEQVSKTAQVVDEELGKNLSKSLEEHSRKLEILQHENHEQMDQRWHQWQTTLSDQARIMQNQQQEMTHQCDHLQNLVSSIADLRRLEDEIHAGVGRLEDVGRLEHASECIAEAVATLATTLERSGVIRGIPIRPRTNNSQDSMGKAA